jgi:hypothetical protein
MEEMVNLTLFYFLTLRYATLTVSVAILVANFGTSVVSPGLLEIAEEFGVSMEVGILAISLYLIGFGKTIHMDNANCSRRSAFCGSFI